MQKPATQLAIHAFEKGVGPIKVSDWNNSFMNLACSTNKSFVNDFKTILVRRNSSPCNHCMGQCGRRVASFFYGNAALCLKACHV